MISKKAFQVIKITRRTLHLSSKLNFLKDSPNTSINKTLLHKYEKLAIPKDISLVDYIWIDGTSEYLRAKTRTVKPVPKKACELPNWTYDGSSTYQAVGSDSDRILVPVALYNDPLRGGNHKLCLCETYDAENKPLKSNHRHACVKAIEQIKDLKPWFGIEQEYSFLGADKRPFGWPRNGFPGPQGPYYCSVGADRAFCREVVDAHYYACLNAGLDIGGTNAEVTPSQWEYQLGPTEGIGAGDQLWISRYILHRIGEEYGVTVTFDPKVTEGWNGAGAHTNFSTTTTRAEGGIKELEKFICKLEKKHAEHIAVYDPNCGKDNIRRLSGKYETSSIHDFTAAVAHRGVSVRLPRLVALEKKGFLEDRRPSANMDPYMVMEAIIQTCLLDCE